MESEARDYAKRAASLFWQRLGRKNRGSSKFEANRIICAVDGARLSLNVLLANARGQRASMVRNYFSALTFSCAPAGFILCIEDFLQSSLAHSNLAFSTGSKETSPKQFIDLSWFWTSVHVLAWYPLFKATVHKTFYKGIEGCVFGICSSKFDSPMLYVLDRWKNLVVLTWLKGVQAHKYASFETRPFGRPSVDSLQRLVSLIVDENYVSARVRELYDIITDFPESTYAVLELRDTLFRTQQHHLMTQALRALLERRLLHSGANTAQIIDMYISIIKVLRVLDPRDIFLNTVTFPVRTYLQHRKDTVRCIVANLTDEISGELYEELHQSKQNTHGCDELATLHVSKPKDDWDPQSKKCHWAKSNTMGDILSMLISIYGTRELFVNEYRCMLAEK